PLVRLKRPIPSSRPALGRAPRASAVQDAACGTGDRRREASWTVRARRYNRHSLDNLIVFTAGLPPRRFSLIIGRRSFSRALSREKGKFALQSLAQFGQGWLVAREYRNGWLDC